VINSGHADARAYLGLARMSTATTLYEQAKREIDKAHALDPSDPDIQLYWIRSLGPSEQVAYLEDYLSHEGSDSAEERTCSSVKFAITSPTRAPLILYL